jgi:hypothetical protein
MVDIVEAVLGPHTALDEEREIGDRRSISAYHSGKPIGAGKARK